MLKGFRGLGYNPEIRSLSSFQDDYGLGGSESDDSEEDADDEEKDSDEDEEGDTRD